MNKIYHYSFLIYRTILIIILPLLIVGKFMAGFAGHNPPLKTSDYMAFFVIICTAILLITFPKIEKTKIKLRNTIRIIIICLVFSNMLFLLYGLYDLFVLSKFGHYQTGDNIPLAIVVFLLIVSSLLLTGLIKRKF